MRFQSNLKKQRMGLLLSCAVSLWLTAPLIGQQGVEAKTVSTHDVVVKATAAEEEAKFNSQQVSIITRKDIEQKQAKTVEDIIFTQTGVSRTVDSMGRVGVSIRGAEPRHTLILIDGQSVMGDLSKYSGQMDEVMRIGTENVDHIEVIQGAASAKYGSDAIGGVINIVTKKATKKPQILFNAEGMRVAGMSGIAPYANYFLRADSGKIGKARVGVYMSKRDVMPVLATREWKKTNSILVGQDKNQFKPNALRFYGTVNSVGITGAYDVSDNHKLNWRGEHYTEDLERTMKHTDNELEPQQIFRRNSTRDSYNVAWNGRKGNTDWNIEANYSKLQEDDISLINYFGKSQYDGKNELRYVDDVRHRQTDLKATANTQVNDKHLLSYGVGYVHEFGEGSRLKSSPNTRYKYVDPFDYDKELLVEKLDSFMKDDNRQGEYIWSHLHDHKFQEDGKTWDKDFEYYGYDEKNKQTYKPQLTIDDYYNYKLWKSGDIDSEDYGSMSDEKKVAWRELKDRLEKENHGVARGNIVGDYFKYGIEYEEYKAKNLATQPEKWKDLEKKIPRLNGKRFLENYWERNNRITTGWGTIKKYNTFLQDTIKINENTIFMPIIRVDNSSLFGTHVSGNIGLTHSINANPHRRFKVNIGTGYTEPGMGELWYNWEMYGSNPVSMNRAKMGWYWRGNPDLKPETSINFDMSIEGESNRTSARLGVFHNRIKNYMTVYYTGEWQDFAPDLRPENKWTQAPDLIYSFKNIGQVEITGIEAEIKHHFNQHWSLKTGWTYLHGVNKSDPLMPKQLLDKPVHKVDISLNYDNQQSGWSGQLWGDYYINMLDSHTLKGKGNYWPDILSEVPQAGTKKTVTMYERKTFGTWNVMVQKRISPDMKVYFGINNLFDHRDDDRATQERMYRWGINVKWGASKGISPKAVRKTLKQTVLTDFITPGFVEDEKTGLQIVGSYQTIFASVGGRKRAIPPFRSNTMVEKNAWRNLQNAPEHGFEQRLTVGVKGKLSSHTSIDIQGSLSASAQVSTKYDIAPSRGLTKMRLEKADVTQHAGKWDVSLGRLQEVMGVTGYWFGREFDGIRAVYTKPQTQVRVGFGAFDKSTGIHDSAYTHSVYTEFYRPPTAAELLGLGYGDASDTDLAKQTEKYDKIYKEKYQQDVKAGKQVDMFFYQQLRDISDEWDAYLKTNPPKGPERDKKEAVFVERQLKLVKRFQEILTHAYPDAFYQYDKKTNTKTSRFVPFERDLGDGTDQSKKIWMYRLKNKKGEHIYRAATDTGVEPGMFDSDIIKEARAKAKEALQSYAGLNLNDPKGLTMVHNPDGTVGIEAFNKMSPKTQEAYKWLARANALAELDNYSQGNLNDNTGMFKRNEKGEWYQDKDDTKEYRYAGNGKSIEDAEDDEWVLDGVESHLIGRLDQDDAATTEARKKYPSRTMYKFDNYGDKLGEILYKGNYTLAKNNRQGKDSIYDLHMPQFVANFLEQLDKTVLRASDSGSQGPRAALEKQLGRPIKTKGLVTRKDVIPSLSRAAFLQVKRQMNTRLGVQAWYFRGQNNTAEKMEYAKQQAGAAEQNGVASFTQLAQVVGIGVKAQIGADLSLSFDYGRNYTDFGRFMNGSSIFEHTKGTADFRVLGRTVGSTPSFWAVKLAMGRSNINVEGSWNAFVDYKAFQHGAFFGGTGAEGVPDRYLDGIRSFTVGAGYVPRKNVFLQGYYTFDAKGMKARDTIYGPENFRLGDYARVQVTYLF